MSSQLQNGSTSTGQRVECRNLLQFAHKSRLNGRFNDVTIIAGKEHIQANRMVLSCYSDFFDTMFQSQMMEQYQTKVEVSGADGKSVKALIDYIYSGHIHIDNNNVLDLLAAANYMLLDEVKQLCFEQLEANLSSETCFNVLNVANLYTNDSLKAMVYRCISENFTEVVASLDFMNLSKTDLISCISNLNRFQVKESSIYQAVITWIKHDQHKRKSELYEFLKLLNISEFLYDFLTNVVSKEELVKEDVNCSNLVMECLAQQLQAVHNKGISQNSTFVFAILSSAICFDQEIIKLDDDFCRVEWNYPVLPRIFFRPAFASLGKFVYLIGGMVFNKDQVEVEVIQNLFEECVSSGVWRINVSDDDARWEEVGSMNEKKYTMGFAVFNGKLVIAGGFDGKNDLSSTEVYDEQGNNWKQISQLNERKRCVALITHGDCLYALGGISDEQPLSTVERLPGLDKDWVFYVPMQVQRSGPAAVSHGGYIYVMGGKSVSGEVLKSIERFVATEKKWENVGELIVARCNPTACVVNDKIYVAGGFSSNEEPVLTVESYNLSQHISTIIVKEFVWNGNIQSIVGL